MASMNIAQSIATMPAVSTFPSILVSIPMVTSFAVRMISFPVAFIRIFFIIG